MDQKNRDILIVDDDRMIRRLFYMLLSPNYTVREAASGEEALDIVTTWQPDLVLLDLMMPGIDGYETCRHLKNSSRDRPPQVIMVSGRSTPAEQVKAFAVGADDYLVKPVDHVELRSRVELHFNLRESLAVVASLHSELDANHQALKRSTQERIEQTLAVQDVAVFTLAKMAETRDKDTGDHIERMREYSQCVANELQRCSCYAKIIDQTFLADLYRSSPLHDIGKIGIPDSILLKPGRLTPAEFEVMKTHTMIGGNILNDAVLKLKGGGFLTMATLIAQFHHEHWNGMGYPAGLIGGEIPLAARIVTVADVFDALTSVRPYKEAWSPDRAKQLIDDAAGTQFDPEVVAAFDRCYEDLLDIRQSYVDSFSTVTGAMRYLEHDLLETV